MPSKALRHLNYTLRLYCRFLSIKTGVFSSDISKYIKKNIGIVFFLEYFIPLVFLC